MASNKPSIGRLACPNSNFKFPNQLRNSGSTQRQFEAECIRRRIFQIGRYFAEPEPFIKCLRLMHDWQRIEAHFHIAHRTSFRNYRLDQRAPGTFAAESRPYIQPFHFTDSVFQFASSDASDRLVVSSWPLT